MLSIVKDDVYIYCLMAGNSPRYVGQTMEPNIRRAKYASGITHLGKKSVNLTFNVLRKTNLANCNRIEAQVIAALAKRFPLLNKTRLSKARPRPMPKGLQIVHVETGKRFDSQAQAARHFGLSATRIKQFLNRGEFILIA